MYVKKSFRLLLTNNHLLSWPGIYISFQSQEAILDWKHIDLRPFSNRPLAIVDAIEVVSLKTWRSENATIGMTRSGTHD